jgi:hypothetical protein
MRVVEDDVLEPGGEEAVALRVLEQLA